MPCYKPLQGFLCENEDGSRSVRFSNILGDLFVKGYKPISDNAMSIPCGRCIGCRLEYSRQWALRIMNEAQLYRDNVFITLTYSDDHLPDGGTLVKEHVSAFMKALRQARVRGREELKCNIISDLNYGIRFFACGEYGEQFVRPHYHICLFNCDFLDKKLFQRLDTGNLYVSEVLSELWSYGHVVIADLSFESAAYVARYCTKKVTGDQKDAHYDGRLPEFPLMSRRPGIGADWFQRFKCDLYPSGFSVVRSGKGVVKCRTPRYYDNILKREDPSLYERIKQAREEIAKDDPDNSYSRLKVREKVKTARLKQLTRRFESGS